MARPIIIDCDPGVDDAVALAMAVASPDELKLLGVTTTYGNVGIERMTLFVDGGMVAIDESETAAMATERRETLSE